MIDLIRKTVLAGIGATVVTKEKIEHALQDLVKQGRVSAQEAREVAGRIAEEGKREWETASDELGRRVHDLLARADFARKADLAALAARVSALEARLDPQPPPAAEPPPAAPESTATASPPPAA